MLPAVPLASEKCLLSKPHGEHAAVGDPLRTVLIGAGSWALKEEGDRQVVLKNSQQAKCLCWSCATTFLCKKMWLYQF